MEWLAAAAAAVEAVIASQQAHRRQEHRANKQHAYADNLTTQQVHCTVVLTQPASPCPEGRLPHVTTCASYRVCAHIGYVGAAITLDLCVCVCAAATTTPNTQKHRLSLP